MFAETADTWSRYLHACCASAMPVGWEIGKNWEECFVEPDAINVLGYPHGNHDVPSWMKISEYRRFMRTARALGIDKRVECSWTLDGDRYVCVATPPDGFTLSTREDRYGRPYVAKTFAILTCNDEGRWSALAWGLARVDDHADAATAIEHLERLLGRLQP